MAFRKSALKGDGTAEARRAVLEEEATRTASDVADLVPNETKDLTPEDIVEIRKLYRQSTMIRIPNHLLDPNYEYRWLNKNPKNWRRRRGIGFTPLNKETLRKRARVPLDQLHMGTHFNTEQQLCSGDDLILAEIPTRIAKAIRKAQHDENQARLRAGKQKFHETGELFGDQGVSTYDTAG